MPSTFAYVWSYQVNPERREEFIDLYAPDGPWVALFRQAPGYLDTQLLQDRDEVDRFITVDRWESREAFSTFRDVFAGEFARLDRLGEQLTSHEAIIGEFVAIRDQRGR